MAVYLILQSCNVAVKAAEALQSGRSFQQSLKISSKYFYSFKNYSFYNILFSISKLCQRNGQSLV